MRGYKIVTLRVHPLQYIPATNEVYLNEELTIMVLWKEVGAQGGMYGQQAPHQRNPSVVIPEGSFEEMVRGLVLNPEAVEKQLPISRLDLQADLSPTNDNDIKYLIITSDDLESAFQTLADWKTQKGVPADVLTTSSIYASY